LHYNQLKFAESGLCLLIRPELLSIPTLSAASLLLAQRFGGQHHAPSEHSDKRAVRPVFVTLSLDDDGHRVQEGTSKPFPTTQRCSN
jgi:hypothetical protein